MLVISSEEEKQRHWCQEDRYNYPDITTCPKSTMETPYQCVRFVQQ